MHGRHADVLARAGGDRRVDPVERALVVDQGERHAQHGHGHRTGRCLEAHNRGWIGHGVQHAVRVGRQKALTASRLESCSDGDSLTSSGALRALRTAGPAGLRSAPKTARSSVESPMARVFWTCLRCLSVCGRARAASRQPASTRPAWRVLVACSSIHASSATISGAKRASQRAGKLRRTSATWLRATR